MTDFRSFLSSLRRPRLLISAARLGLSDYRRDRDLQRLIGAGTHAAPQRTLPVLIDAEERMEQTRQAGDLGYSAARHIEFLIALMAEARMLPRNLT